MRNRTLVRHMVQSGIVKNQKDLGEKMGYKNESAFSQVINEKVVEPKNFTAKLKKILPNLNEQWLTTGEGSMLIPITPISTGVVKGATIPPVRVVVNTDKKLVLPKRNALTALSLTGRGKQKLVTSNTDGTFTIENVEESVTPIPIASVQANIDTGKLSPNENTEMVTADNAEVIPVVPAKIVREENVDIVEYVEKKYDDIEKITLNQLFPDVDVFHRVTSDSMVPAINPGDMVALKKITDPGLIFLGEPYALNTVSTGLFIRYITDMNETAIYCEAADEDKKPFWVEKSKITNAFAIAGYIGQNIIALDRSKVALIKEQRERIAHLETLVDTACEREKKLIDQQQKLIDFLTK